MTHVPLSSASSAESAMLERALRWSDVVVIALLVWSISVSDGFVSLTVSAAVLGLLGWFFFLPGHRPSRDHVLHGGVLLVDDASRRQGDVRWAAQSGQVASLDCITGEVQEGNLSVQVAQRLASLSRLYLGAQRAGRVAVSRSLPDGLIIVHEAPSTTEVTKAYPRVGPLKVVHESTAAAAVGDDAVRAKVASYATLSTAYWGASALKERSVRLMDGLSYFSAEDVLASWPSRPPSLGRQLIAALSALPHVEDTVASVDAHEPHSTEFERALDDALRIYHQLLGRSALLDVVFLPVLRRPILRRPLLDLGGLLRSWLLDCGEEVCRRRDAMNQALRMLALRTEGLNLVGLECAEARRVLLGPQGERESGA